MQTLAAQQRACSDIDSPRFPRVIARVEYRGRLTIGPVASKAGLPDEVTPTVPAISASQVLPWEIHPAPAAERLPFCARLLANARRDAVRTASPEMLDDSWSFGCRGYAFGKQRLQRQAEGRTHDWLLGEDAEQRVVRVKRRSA